MLQSRSVPPQANASSREEMGQDTLRIGIVAPGSRLEPAIAEAVLHLAEALYPARPPELHFSPPCFLSSRHFAGDHETRARPFLHVPNAHTFDALCFPPPRPR